MHRNPSPKWVTLRDGEKLGTDSHGLLAVATTRRRRGKTALATSVR
jgi:hypothetical protein